MTRQVDTPQNSTSLSNYNYVPQTYHQPATVPSYEHTYTPMSSAADVPSYGHTYTQMSSSASVNNNMYSMYIPMNTSFVIPSSSYLHRFNEITSQLSKHNVYHSTLSTAMTANCSWIIHHDKVCEHLVNHLIQYNGLKCNIFIDAVIWDVKMAYSCIVIFMLCSCYLLLLFRI